MLKKEQTSDEFIAQCREDLATGRFRSERECEETLGLPAGRVRAWREQRLPDGLDWASFKPERNTEIVPVIPAPSIATPFQIATGRALVGARMLNMGNAYLGVEMLYTAPPGDPDRRELMEYLPNHAVFTAAGDMVPLGKMDPKMVTMAMQLVKQGDSMLADGSAVMEHLRSTEERLRAEMDLRVLGLLAFLDLTPEQKQEAEAYIKNDWQAPEVKVGD